MSRWRHLRAIVLLPGMVTIGIPALLLCGNGGWRASARLRGPTDLLALVAGGTLVVAGLVLWARTVALLARIGRGTLAPWDPTRRLVVEGVYRHVRNPMITAVLAVLLGETVLLGSWRLLAWSLLFFALNALYIPLVEEPGLARRFGDDYALYVRHVPRWLPRWRAWRPPRNGAGGLGD